MGTRSWVASAVLILGLASSAHADPKGDIQAKNKEAMESYDMMDYEAAKKLLTQALATAKKAKLDKDPVTAHVYLSIGIAAFAAGDADGAKAAFTSAVQIDPKIQIDAAYKSPELVKLLDEARASAGSSSSSGGGSSEPAGDGTDCSAVKGLQHNIIDSAKAGVAQPIELLLGSDIKPVKVSVWWRTEGQTDFSEAKLTKQGDCKYTGQIPAAAMHGGLVHYYVGAFDANNKMMAGKGSSGSPNIIELSGGGQIKNDEEDPINGTKKPKSGGDAGGAGSVSVSGGVIAGGKAPKVMIAVMGGTGFGYVTGDTEGGNPVESCCIGNSFVVLTPELGYYVNSQISVGLAARVGLPIGANVNAMDRDGHSTIAPAVLLRLRYALSRSGEGIRVMAQVGGGVMRNTIKLKGQPSGMDTDIVGQGPLLIGAGVGYTKKLGGAVSFVADVSALGGIAVTSKVGGLKVNNGIGADLSLGLALGF